MGDPREPPDLAWLQQDERSEPAGGLINFDDTWLPTINSNFSTAVPSSMEVGQPGHRLVHEGVLMVGSNKVGVQVGSP